LFKRNPASYFRAEKFLSDQSHAMFTLQEESWITPSRLGDLGMARFCFSILEFFPGQGGLFEHVASLQLGLEKILDYMGR
jgi:hypothetical protein